MEKIATDTFPFERLRTEGCVYVDKTEIPKHLADGSNRVICFGCDTLAATTDDVCRNRAQFAETGFDDIAICRW